MEEIGGWGRLVVGGDRWLGEIGGWEETRGSERWWTEIGGGRWREMAGGDARRGGEDGS